MRTGVRLLVLIVAIACAVAAVPSKDTASAAQSSSLRRYPYLTDLVTSYVTVNWATTTGVTAGTVRYGRSGTESCTANSVTATKTSITVGSTKEYQWKGTLSGLQANTAYCYRIYGAATDLLGSDPSPIFRSQVAAGSSAPYSFAVFGDWGYVGSSGQNADQARLMGEIADSGARFAITTGDTAYDDGSQRSYGDLVQTGPATSTIFGPSFWTVAGDSIPLFNTQGNHGMNGVGLVNWPQDRAVASSEGRYRTETYCCFNDTDPRSYPSTWYAFDAGPARFYVLEASWSNSNVGDADLYENDYDAHWTSSRAEYQWLADDLATHPRSMSFAFFHFPMYSDNTSETSDTWLTGSSRLEGLLANYGVDIVFNGHAHIYQRNRASATGRPVSYVTGGGGAPLQTVKKCTSIDQYAIGWTNSSAVHGSACGSAPRPTTADRVFHFLLVSVNGSQVTVTPTDELGRTFDVKSYTFG